MVWNRMFSTSGTDTAHQIQVLFGRGAGPQKLVVHDDEEDEHLDDDDDDLQ